MEALCIVTIANKRLSKVQSFKDRPHIGETSVLGGLRVEFEVKAVRHRAANTEHLAGMTVVRFEPPDLGFLGSDDALVGAFKSAGWEVMPIVAEG